MKVVALSCPQCGGSQDVSDDQNLVECRYCRTRLRAERGASGEIERLLNENELLELENAIHRLDKEWEGRRQKLLVRTKRSGKRKPSSTWGTIVAILGCGGLAVNLVLLLTLGIPREPQIVLFFMAAIFVFAGLSERAAGIRFEREEAAYQQCRLALIGRLAALERSARNRRNYEDTTSRRKRLNGLSYPAADA